MRRPHLAGTMRSACCLPVAAFVSLSFAAPVTELAYIVRDVLPEEGLTIPLNVRTVNQTQQHSVGVGRNLPLTDVFRGTDLQVRLATP